MRGPNDTARWSVGSWAGWGITDGKTKSMTRASEKIYPILVTVGGRCGTTAVMNLLSTDPRVAMERTYPFEHRYLTYFAKLASVLENRGPDERFTSDQLFEFDDSILGPWQWNTSLRGTAAEWLGGFWNSFAAQLRKVQPTARFYAEKVPVWVSPIVRQVMECLTIFLFRDPRDIYLSANAFMKKLNYYSFARSQSDSDVDHARNLTFELLKYFDNYFMSKGRSDCTMIRYEDFVLRPEILTEPLRKLGLDTQFQNASEHFDEHRTSADLTSSVERWRREELPDEVNTFFQRHFGNEMSHLGYPSPSTQGCPTIEFRSETLDLRGITSSTHGSMEVGKDATTVHISGHDFWMMLPFAPFRSDDVREVWVSVAGCVGDHCSIYWRNPGADFSEERRIHLKYYPGPHWRVLRFKVNEHPLWHGTIEQIRIDIFNGQTKGIHGTGYIRWVRLIN